MLAARKVDAPLKWVEDRRENLLAAGKSRQEHGTTTMAFSPSPSTVIQACPVLTPRSTRTADTSTPLSRNRSR